MNTSTTLPDEISLSNNTTAVTAKHPPKLPIYLDYSATTPVDPRVAKKMFTYLTDKFGNPASQSHVFGWEAADAVEQARRNVAKFIQADPAEIVWTSGATESNNLAIKGAALFYQSKGRHLITMTTEHKAVLDTMQEMESLGFEVTYLNPAENGLINLDEFKATIRPDTIFASVMAVNNEIGVIQPIDLLGEICREKNIIFHVDAAQAAGKIVLDLSALKVDLMSFSAHKFYGPKGIGALYVRRDPQVGLKIQMHGGGHEDGRRSGTLPTHQIVGMGEACRIAQEDFAIEKERIKALRDRLLDELLSLSNIHINGDREQRVPHNLNFYFDSGKGLFPIQELYEIAVSSGSACTSATGGPSYVLTALGRSARLAGNSIRLSIGRFTTEDEIDFTIDIIRKKALEYNAC